jgi:hypothetical protein
MTDEIANTARAAVGLIVKLAPSCLPRGNAALFECGGNYAARSA